PNSTNRARRSTRSSPPPEPTALRRSAPARGRGALRRSGSGRCVRRRTTDEGDALVVRRVPGVVVGSEGEALFVVRGVGEQGPALARVLLDLLPEHVADPGRRVADEDARGDLQEPAGQEAP